MYAILTLFAGFIAVMFIATATTSIINAYRESQAVRLVRVRRTNF